MHTYVYVYLYILHDCKKKEISVMAWLTFFPGLSDILNWFKAIFHTALKQALSTYRKYPQSSANFEI